MGDKAVKVLDLFSGIGGFSLGLERAGMETVAFCEYDDKCRQVLTKHWPDVPQYTDVRTLTGEQLEQDGITDIGLICGGYPCQPFSNAGKRKGAEDDRHLWPEFFRLIRKIQPNWVIAENVAGHINMGLDEVLSDLEGEGYTTQPFIIPACAINAPHRRDRVWIIAHSDKSSEPNGTIDEDKGRGKLGIVGDTKGVGLEGCGENQNAAYSAPSRKGETNHAFPSSELGIWETEPAVGRVANGVPGRVDRLKQLGNAVVPQIPEIIGRAIMEIEDETRN